VLLEALKDEASYVRRAAARNPNSTEQVLLEAIKDEEQYVHAAAAENPNATERLLINAPSSPIGFYILLSHVGRR
jgi:HEAT repeat protein